MNQYESLRKNREFQLVYHTGRSKVNRTLVMIVRKNDRPLNRYGISVSKKIGNSVVRHRVKRVVREVIRLNNDCILQGYDIVIVGRSDSASGDYQKIESAILHLLNLHRLISDNNRK